MVALKKYENSDSWILRIRSSSISQPFRGDSNVQAIGLSVARHDCICANDAAFGDGCIGGHGDVGAQPHVFDEGDRAGYRRNQAHRFIAAHDLVMADRGKHAVGGDIAVWTDLQPAPAIQDASGREMRMVADLNPTAFAAGGDILVREKIDIVLNDDSVGRPLDEKVGIEGAVVSDAHLGRTVHHVERAHESDIVSDDDALGMLDIDFGIDRDVLATRFEEFAIVGHGGSGFGCPVSGSALRIQGCQRDNTHGRNLDVNRAMSI